MESSEYVHSAKAIAQQLKKALLQIQERPDVRAEWGNGAYSNDLAWIEKWIHQLDNGRVNEVWRDVQHISRILSSGGDLDVRPLETEFREAVLEAVVEFRSRK